MSETAPHVGMKIWRWNENRRVYVRDVYGRAVGGPIWREHWEPCEIIGETSRSWLIGQAYITKWPNWERRAERAAKADFPGCDYAMSEADIERRAFVEGRHKLAEAIRDCRDYDTLKAVEAALGRGQA